MDGMIEPPRKPARRLKLLTMTIHRGGHGAFDRQRRLSRALIQAGHQVVWMAPGLDETGDEIFLPVPPRSVRLPGFIGWIWQLLGAFRLHRAALRDVDMIFTVREYDTLACVLDPQLKHIPHIFFMHGDTYECERFQARHAFHWRQRLRSFITATMYPPIQRFAFPRMKRIVAIAEFLGDHLRGRIRVPLPRIDVVVNDSVPPGDLPAAEGAIPATIETFRPKDGILIGVIAQIYFHGKGFDVFLKSMNRLKNEPGVRAVLIGYGAEEDAVPQYIRENGLEDKVLFLGRSSAARTFMHLFDIIVAPTRFCDGWPMVVLEGMQAERCILASDIEAHVGQLVHPELLFKNNDDAELAARILQLRDSAPARERNRTLVRERLKHFQFDWEGNILKIIDNVAETVAK
jgi:glycosyltransferase involved in cell wall biosynthesis